MTVRIATLLTIFLLAQVSSPVAFSEAAPDLLRESIDKAVASVKPALVRIHVVVSRYREGREVRYMATGSGVIVSEEGYVITNHHVAGHATRIVCVLSTREEIDAVLVGTDAPTDIAIVKLLPDEPRRFPVAKFGDSDAIAVGDPILAMGSPMAISQSVTLGIISNTEMVMPRSRRFGSFKLDGEDVGSLVRWIAHDAQIYGGNSEGPLVNLRGEIVGINEIKFGLSGAIPGNLAHEIADSLIAYGKAKRSWIGAGIRPRLKHSGREVGALVSFVIEDSPAAQAGLQSGDRILSFGGHDVNVQFDEELPAFNRLVANSPIGQDVAVVVERDGKELSLAIKTVEWEEMLPRQREVKQMGLTMRDMSFVMSKELKREERMGAVITSIRPGGPAGEAKPALTRGDIITNLGDEEVRTTDDLVRIIDRLTIDAAKPLPVLATFDRKAGTFVTVVMVGTKELNDPGLEVKKAWLPAESQVITRTIATQMDRPGLTGFRVTQVYADSTADRAGLKVGDFIVAVDGEKLTASAPEHYEELPTLIRSYRAGTVVDLKILREGKESIVAVELERSPRLSREMRKYRDEDFEFTVRDVTFFDRAEEKWEQDDPGVLVDEVKSGGWAALGMLNVGDLIRSIDGKDVFDVDGIKSRMEEVVKGRPKAVVFKVLRGIYTLYIELEPKWSELS